MAAKLTLEGTFAFRFVGFDKERMLLCDVLLFLDYLMSKSNEIGGLAVEFEWLTRLQTC